MPKYRSTGRLRPRIPTPDYEPIPDPHEQAVEAMARVLHAEMFSGCVSWHDTTDTATTGSDEDRRRALDFARKALQAALPHLQQERPAPAELCDCERCRETRCECAECRARRSQPNPPSRAGEVAEELRAIVARIHKAALASDPAVALVALAASVVPTECSSGYCGWSPEGDPHTCPQQEGSQAPPFTLDKLTEQEPSE